MPGVSIGSVVVLALIAAIVVPIIMSEIARRRVRRPPPKPARPVKPEPAAAKTPLRLVVNRNDMDRELAALLAKDSRKSTEREE